MKKVEHHTIYKQSETMQNTSIDLQSVLAPSRKSKPVKKHIRLLLYIGICIMSCVPGMVHAETFSINSTKNISSASVNNLQLQTYQYASVIKSTISCFFSKLIGGKNWSDGCDEDKVIKNDSQSLNSSDVQTYEGVQAHAQPVLVPVSPVTVSSQLPKPTSATQSTPTLHPTLSLTYIQALIDQSIGSLRQELTQRLTSTQGAQTYSAYPTGGYSISAGGPTVDDISRSITNLQTTLTTDGAVFNNILVMSGELSDALLTNPTVEGSVLLSDNLSAPATTTNKLYAQGGDLYYGGNLIGGATTGNWASNGTDVWRASGKVGIGTTSPLSKLTIGSLSTGLALQVVNNPGGISLSSANTLAFAAESTFTSGATSGAFAALYSNDGAAMSSGDRLGGFLIGGSSGAGTQLRNSTLIASYASEDWIDGSAYGSRIAFETTANGGTTRSEKLTILGNGNIGIGTTSPIAKLAITGTAGNNDMLAIASSTGASAFIVKGNGNVGVGVSDPTAKLDVNGNISTSGNLILNGKSITAFGNDIVTLNSHFTAQFGLWIRGSRGYTGIDGSTGLMSLYTNGSEKVRIDSSGNVGVGTTSPIAKLAITGTAGNNDILAIASSTGASALIVKANGNVGIGTNTPLTTLHIKGDSGALYGSGYYPLVLEATTGDYEGMVFRGPGGLHGALRVENGDGFSFLNGSGSSISGYLLRITSAGNIGIGSSSPSARLVVKGSGTGTGLLAQFTDSSNTPKVTILDNGNVGVGTTNPVNKLTINTPNIYDGSVVRMQASQEPTGYALTMGASYITGGLVGWNFSVTNGYQEYPNVLSFERSSIGIGTTSPIAKLAIRGTAGNNDMFAIASSTGASAFIVKANGNVGVGVSSPATPLHVVNMTPQSTLGYALKLSNNTSGNGGVTGIGFGINGGSGDPIIKGAIIYDGTNLSSGPYSWYRGDIKFLQRASTDSGPATISDVAMIIQNNGNVGISTTTPGQKLTVAGTIQSTDLLGGATTLSTDANGNIIRTPSDQTLKTNIETLTSSLDKVKQLRGVSYKWIDEAKFGSSSEIGLIAQEVQTVVPEVVKGGGSYLSVNYQNLVALLIEAIKELATKIEGFADHFKSKKIETDELCIGKTCIKESELQDFLRSRETSSGYTSDIESLNSTDDTSSPTAESNESSQSNESNDETTTESVSESIETEGEQNEQSAESQIDSEDAVSDAISTTEIVVESASETIPSPGENTESI